MIVDAHTKVKHSGIQATMNYLRQNYWIPKMRAMVKSTLRHCITCKKLTGHPYPKVVTAQLPGFRTQQTAPFAVTGVDFTGAVSVRSQNDGKIRECYICLFTCANTRAIHLELVSNLSTQNFLNAFRRFAARRSFPQLMISDNATTFQCAAKSLREMSKSGEIAKFMSTQGVKWTFIAKRAPWFGGFWERLIGMTKMALKKVIGRALITYEELQTLLCEIEAMINDRPITYTYGDVNEPLPLTPSHLLHGRLITPTPFELVERNDISDPSFKPVDTSTLKKRQKMLAFVLNSFWKRWLNEYLPSLRERHIQTKPGTKTNSVKVGEVVLIHDDNKKRLDWNLGVITKLLPGPDGVVRVVEIRTKMGKTNRPITKLYPLEMNEDNSDDSDQNMTDQSDMTSLTDKDIPVRPKRKAAEKATKIIKNMSAYLNE